MSRRTLTINAAVDDDFAVTFSDWVALGLRADHWGCARITNLKTNPLMLQAIWASATTPSLVEKDPYLLTCGSYNIGRFATYQEAKSVIAHLVLCGATFGWDLTDH